MQPRTQEDVLDHVEIGQQRKLLVDGPDARSEGSGRRVEPDRLPIKQDRAGVRLFRAAQQAHQGRLAGAVLAHDRVDLATGRCKRHTAHCPDAAERLHDVRGADEHPALDGGHPAVSGPGRSRRAWLT